MFAIFLDRNQKTPLYEQLYKSIRSMIEEGTLQSGEKVPSKRKLSAQLAISLVTVENAYAQLMAEGYLKSLPKSGIFVEHDIQPLFPQKNVQPSIPTQKPGERETWRYDFRTNVVDPELFPYAQWAKMTREAILSLGHESINEVDPQGAYGLRKAISEYLSVYRGIHSDPAQIIVGAGSEYLLGLVIQLLGPDCVVALENPGYAKIAKTFQSHQITTVPIALDDQGLRIDLLEKSKATLVHLTPSHQFPSGVIMPVGRRSQLLNWASGGANRYILEDDYDSEFRFSGMPIPAMQGMDRNGKVIYFNSFSKSLAPSLRISYMVLPWDLVPRYRKSLTFYACSVPIFEQKMVETWMNGGFFERHVFRMRNAYKERRDLIIQALQGSALSSVISISHHDAGLHFLLHVQNGMNEEELVSSAKNMGVRVYGYSDYFLAPDSELNDATVVIGYSAFPSADIVPAICALEKAWLPSLITE